MKITQEVREFAASAANRGRPGYGRDLETRDFRGEADWRANCGFPGESHSPDRSADTFLAAQEAHRGMADMSEQFRQKGGEIYLPQK
jgi:hypothetical protein